jgi:outer membrane protein
MTIKGGSMRKIKYFILAVFFCFPFLLSQEKTGQTLKLTLKDCLLKALENNLDISVEAFEPEISETALSEAKEVFLPQFALSYGDLNQNTPGTWGIEGTNIKMKANDYSVGLSQKVPTGADLSLSFTNSMTDTSRAFSIVNPSYYSILSLRLAQPLLKGFGPKINRREIIMAENQKEISIYRLKSSVIQTIYDVEEAYWNLAYAIESLKVIEYSLEQIQRAHGKTVRSGDSKI